MLPASQLRNGWLGSRPEIQLTASAGRTSRRRNAAVSPRIRGDRDAPGQGARGGGAILPPDDQEGTQGHSQVDQVMEPGAAGDQVDGEEHEADFEQQAGCSDLTPRPPFPRRAGGLAGPLRGRKGGIG